MFYDYGSTGGNLDSKLLVRDDFNSYFRRQLTVVSGWWIKRSVLDASRHERTGVTSDYAWNRFGSVNRPNDEILDAGSDPL